jgi:hypothetical protein
MIVKQRGLQMPTCGFEASYACGCKCCAPAGVLSDSPQAVTTACLSGTDDANCFTDSGQFGAWKSTSVATTADVAAEYTQSPGLQVAKNVCVCFGSALASSKPCHRLSAQLLMLRSTEVTLCPALASASNRPLKMAQEQLLHSA